MANCKYEGCTKQGIYGEIGNLFGTYCIKHKSEKMKRIQLSKCRFIECPKR